MAHLLGVATDATENAQDLCPMDVLLYGHPFEVTCPPIVDVAVDVIDHKDRLRLLERYAVRQNRRQGTPDECHEDVAVRAAVEIIETRILGSMTSWLPGVGRRLDLAQRALPQVRMRVFVQAIGEEPSLPRAVNRFAFGSVQRA